MGVRPLRPLFLDEAELAAESLPEPQAQPLAVRLPDDVLFAIFAEPDSAAPLLPKYALAGARTLHRQSPKRLARLARGVAPLTL